MGASADATSRGSSRETRHIPGWTSGRPWRSRWAPRRETRTKAATRVRDLARGACVVRGGREERRGRRAGRAGDAFAVRRFAERRRRDGPFGDGFRSGFLASRCVSAKRNTKSRSWARRRGRAHRARPDGPRRRDANVTAARTAAATPLLSPPLHHGDDDDDDDEDVRQARSLGQACGDAPVFALARTTPVRIALVADRALSALAPLPEVATPLAAAAGVLWVAATPPETLGDAGVEGARASKVTEHVTERAVAPGGSSPTRWPGHLPLLVEANDGEGRRDDGTPSGRFA